MEEDHDNMEEDVLDSVSNLHKTRRYISIMQEVEKMSTMLSNQGDSISLSMASIVQGFQTLTWIFLAQLLNYARAVKKIGNEMDLALVDLKGVLSPADIGCVSWKGIGKPLPEEILRKTFDACDRLLALHSDYEKVCTFVGSITEYFVPNLCAVFGSEVASKLIVGTAGGLSALANIRADDLSLVGAKKMIDFQRFFGEMPQFRCLGESNLLSGIPGRVRFFAYRYVARSSTVAARVDWKRGDQTGMTGSGRRIRDEIIGVSERWRKSDPLPIFKPEEGKIDAKVYGVKHAAMGKLGKIQAKKPRKMKWDEIRAKLEPIFKKRKMNETSDEIWAKLEAIKKQKIDEVGRSGTRRRRTRCGPSWRPFIRNGSDVR